MAVVLCGGEFGVLHCAPKWGEQKWLAVGGFAWSGWGEVVSGRMRVCRHMDRSRAGCVSIVRIYTICVKRWGVGHGRPVLLSPLRRGGVGRGAAAAVSCDASPK